MKSLTLILFTISTFFSANGQNDVFSNPQEAPPTYQGCEHLKSNRELQKCMSHSISSLVNNNFNTKIADSLDLTNETVKIRTSFLIDTLGKVANIKILESPHPKLSKEAQRVLELIPRMSKPATQRFKPVNIHFNLPIFFKVNGVENKKED